MANFHTFWWNTSNELRVLYYWHYLFEHSNSLIFLVLRRGTLISDNFPLEKEKQCSKICGWSQKICKTKKNLMLESRELHLIDLLNFWLRVKYRWRWKYILAFTFCFVYVNHLKLVFEPDIKVMCSRFFPSLFVTKWHRLFFLEKQKV